MQEDQKKGDRELEDNLKARILELDQKISFEESRLKDPHSLGKREQLKKLVLGLKVVRDQLNLQLNQLRIDQYKFQKETKKNKVKDKTTPKIKEKSELSPPDDSGP